MSEKQPAESTNSLQAERQQVFELLRFLGFVVAGVVITSLVMVVLLTAFS
jgi:hypothetical protein